MKTPTKKPPRYTLGTPAPASETRDTLRESESVPITAPKVDGRTLRRTGRTAQLNVLLSPDFRDRLAKTAELDRLTYPQLLAVMLRAYSELTADTKNAYISELMQTWGK